MVQRDSSNFALFSALQRKKIGIIFYQSTKAMFLENIFLNDTPELFTGVPLVQVDSF
jgi:hypothetical protein